MIHILKLPRLTRRCLTDIVRIQMALLHFAASTTEYSRSACEAYFTDGRCLHRTLQDRGRAIADWLWAHPARQMDLEWFSRACGHLDESKAEQQQRKRAVAWCQQLHLEVEMLLHPRCHEIFLGDHFSDKPFISEKEKREKKAKDVLLDYREHACDFLLAWYDTCLGKSGDDRSRPAFPATLFTYKKASKYGRREFLDAFIKENADLEICPYCDENRLYIKNKSATHTDIDHFLPKSKYPHLACHPYNLVPLCHHCNSSTKGDIDPYKERVILGRSLYPYGRIKLRHHAYLTINQEQELTLQSHQNPPPGKSETATEKSRRLAEVEDAITLLKDVYGIPERWHNMQKTYIAGLDEREADKEDLALQARLMSETLVRRICQFFGHSERFLGFQERLDSSPDVLRGSNLAEIIDNNLRHLLYYLDHDDQGKEPFVFAMTWILAEKIQGEVASALARGELSPLGQEIAAWFNQNQITFKQREEHVKSLLERLR